MKSLFVLSTGILFFLIFSLNNNLLGQSRKLTYRDSLMMVSDSIRVDNIVVHNLFKSQILAHQNGAYDSLMIVKNVYRPHQQLWDGCYGMIFGEENASRFNNPSGMIAWNKTLYPENKAAFDLKTRQLISMNLDSILKFNLHKFNQMVKVNPQAVISTLFTPLQGIGFGGCNADQFALELNYANNNLDYTIHKGIPHELNHLAYEPGRLKDPLNETALAQVIDEGFACYFTWVFFDRKIKEREAVENMSEKEWNWYLKNEKEIFRQVKVYFNSKDGNNPLLRNEQFKLFPDAPKTLFYWLGFRIIQSYTDLHGPESWKDIYKLPIAEVLNKSGYEKKMQK